MVLARVILIVGMRAVRLLQRQLPAHLRGRVALAVLPVKLVFLGPPVKLCVQTVVATENVPRVVPVIVTAYILARLVTSVLTVQHQAQAVIIHAKM